MPTSLPYIKTYMLSSSERASINQQARAANLSTSNFIRAKLGLAPLKHGGDHTSKKISEKVDQQSTLVNPERV